VWEGEYDYIFDHFKYTKLYIKTQCDSNTKTHRCTPTGLGLDVGPPVLKKTFGYREADAQDFLHGCQKHEQIRHLVLEIVLQ
jgi:hypothetical protein